MENNGVTPKTVAYNLMCQDINHFKLLVASFINENKVSEFILCDMIANLHFMLCDFIEEYDSNEKD